jgi:hypothetical protein
MSNLVAIRYSSDPIMLWYSFWSMASPSSSASSAIVVDMDIERVGLAHTELLQQILGVLALVHERPFSGLLDW